MCCLGLFDVITTENVLKIGTCRNISEVEVKCNVGTCAFVAITMFIDECT